MVICITRLGASLARTLGNCMVVKRWGDEGEVEGAIEGGIKREAITVVS